ncbi:MAG: hypothetical protein OEW12_05200, partial [Deltaproteobacteria bacterium]|nr:hypothetical protein [Deltaproteobacteria bacterium]
YLLLMFFIYLIIPVFIHTLTESIGHVVTTIRTISHPFSTGNPPKKGAFFPWINRFFQMKSPDWPWGFLAEKLKHNPGWRGACSLSGLFTPIRIAFFDEKTPPSGIPSPSIRP